MQKALAILGSVVGLMLAESVAHPAQAQSAVETPSNCHWVDSTTVRGQSQLWCRNAQDRFEPVGSPRNYNATDYSDGCPVGQKYNGVSCVPAAATAVTATAPSPEGPSPGAVPRVGGGNLAELVDELILTDSRGWMFNSYRPGSARNVRVVEQTKDRRSAVVAADYSYGGGSSGWVKARIKDGVFTCVEYWDFQGKCRPVGQSSYSYGLAAGLAVAVVACAITCPGGGGGGEHGSVRERQNAEAEAEFRFEQNQARDRNYSSCGNAYC